MINKMQTTKNNMNIEEIMQMNQILKPFQEKTQVVDQDKIKDKCIYIEVFIKSNLSNKNLERHKISSRFFRSFG